MVVGESVGARCGDAELMDLDPLELTGLKLTPSEGRGSNRMKGRIDLSRLEGYICEINASVCEVENLVWYSL